MICVFVCVRRDYPSKSNKEEPPPSRYHGRVEDHEILCLNYGKLVIAHYMVSIARMKNIHYLFYITSKILLSFTTLINPNILENANSVFIAPFQVKGHRGVPMHAALYYCTLLLNDGVTCVQWSISYHVTLYHPIK